MCVYLRCVRRIEALKDGNLCDDGGSSGWERERVRVTEHISPSTVHEVIFSVLNRVNVKYGDRAWEY